MVDNINLDDDVLEEEKSGHNRNERQNLGSDNKKKVVNEKQCKECKMKEGETWKGWGPVVSNKTESHLTKKSPQKMMKVQTMRRTFPISSNKKTKKEINRKKVAKTSHVITDEVVVGWNKDGMLESNLSKSCSELIVEKVEQQGRTTMIDMKANRRDSDLLEVGKDINNYSLQGQSIKKSSQDKEGKRKRASFAHQDQIQNKEKIIPNLDYNNKKKEKEVEKEEK
eukprot:15328180-Ditylum_brightwellii.AAC.1